MGRRNKPGKPGHRKALPPRPPRPQVNTNPSRLEGLERELQRQFRTGALPDERCDGRDRLEDDDD